MAIESKRSGQGKGLAKYANAFTIQLCSPTVFMVDVFMVDVQELLNPISEENPCGVEISYDPQFLALDTLIAGKPETQFSAAEEPDWRAIREACVELFRRAKNLRVGVALCLALVNLEGASGLRSGLTLLRGLLERYWPHFYPRLDPEENNDPLERINILSSLTTPIGTFGDPIRFLQRLRQMPVANSPQMGRLSLAQIAGDRISLHGADGTSPLSAAQINAAFRDTSLEELMETGRAISESITLARSIDSFLTHEVGPSRAPDMSALLALLTEIAKCLAPYLPKTFTNESIDTLATTSSEPTDAQPLESGVIRSRQDVVRALERICEYYSRYEPSSPLPFLLRRAQRLVEMNFVQIIDELTPEARTNLQTIIGGNAATGVGEGVASEPE